MCRHMELHCLVFVWPEITLWEIETPRKYGHRLVSRETSTYRLWTPCRSNRYIQRPR